MRKLILFALLAFGSVLSAHAQSEVGIPTACPADKVCISRQAAEKALADAKQVDADKVLAAAYEKAIADYKIQLAEMRATYAEAAGENTVYKQNAVRDGALIELLVKMVRPKVNGIKIF